MHKCLDDGSMVKILLNLVYYQYWLTTKIGVLSKVAFKLDLSVNLVLYNI